MRSMQKESSCSRHRRRQRTRDGTGNHRRWTRSGGSADSWHRRRQLERKGLSVRLHRYYRAHGEDACAEKEKRYGYPGGREGIVSREIACWTCCGDKLETLNQYIKEMNTIVELYQRCDIPDQPVGATQHQSAHVQEKEKVLAVGHLEIRILQPRPRVQRPTSHS